MFVKISPKICIKFSVDVYPDFCVMVKVYCVCNLKGFPSVFGKPKRLYSIQTACHTALTHLQMYHTVAACCTTLTHLHIMYCAALECLSYHSRIYRSCTAFKLPVVPFAHLQIMYCTAFKVPVIPLSHLPTVYCTAFRLSYHLYVCRLCTVQQSNCLSYHTHLQISCTVQQSNCLW